MALNTPTITQRGNHVDVSHGDDRGLFVEFFADTKQDMEASDKQGRPIFFDIVKVKIIPLGDKTTQIIRMVKDQDKHRFAKQWEAYERQGNQEVGDGTPLHEWPPLLKSQVMELKGMNIHTVEKLAEVGDNMIGNVPKGMEIRKKAIAYIEGAKDSKAATIWAKEKSELENRIDTLQKQVEEIGKIKATKQKD